jgi:hypothetical protein
MLLSEFLLKNSEAVSTFDELKGAIQKEAVATGQIYFKVDIEPPVYSDRPEDWHDQLELAFESAR